MKLSSEKRSLMLALLVMLLWGSLFPMVKIGYRVCQVNTSSVADILMFAGVRFVVCGVIITAMAAAKKQKLDLNLRESLIPLGVMGLFSIVLHYACTYTGLTLTDSSKTAILKQLGALLYICFSFLFVKEEKFNLFKLIGGIVGFAGIAVINAGADGSGSLSTGDVLIIGASVCTVVSNLASKSAMKRNPPMLTTGLSQLFGGVILMAVSIAMGGVMPQMGLSALPVFGYICIASIAGYCLWFSIVRTGLLSQLFIIKFAEPIFASIFGALLLGENILRWQYLAAFLLISLGILISHQTKPARASSR